MGFLARGFWGFVFRGAMFSCPGVPGPQPMFSGGLVPPRFSDLPSYTSTTCPICILSPQRSLGIPLTGVIPGTLNPKALGVIKLQVNTEGAAAASRCHGFHLQP